MKKLKKLWILGLSLNGILGTAPALAAAAEIVPEVGSASTTKLLRVCNPNSGEHFYTSSAREKNYLMRLGWISEGLG